MHGDEKCSLDELGDRHEVFERIERHLAERWHNNDAERWSGEQRCRDEQSGNQKPKCSEMQGFIFSRQFPAHEMEAFFYLADETFDPGAAGLAQRIQRVSCRQQVNPPCPSHAPRTAGPLVAKVPRAASVRRHDVHQGVALLVEHGVASQGKGGR